MRLPARASRRQDKGTTVNLGESSIETDCYSTVSAAAGFAPDTLTLAPQKTACTQVFVADSDGVSIASSTYDSPCRPSFGNGSFYSGVLRKGDVFSVERTLADLAEPLFFYSARDNDCANGRTGVLNPSPAQTLQGYRARARDYAQPGLAPSSAFGGTLHPFIVPAVLPDPEPSALRAVGGLPVGVVIGATLGAICGAGLLLGLAWFAWCEYARRRRGVADVSGDVPPPKLFDDSFERAFGDMPGRSGSRMGVDSVSEGQGHGDLGDLGDLDMRRSWGSCEKVAIGTMSLARQSCDRPS